MRALEKLNVSYNPVMGGVAYVDDMAMVGGTDETYVNPENFQEAWNHPDEKGRQHW